MTTSRSGTRASKRRFGNIRKLPSGRYQARYTAPDGREHKAPFTFQTKGDADTWLAVESAKVTTGTWEPPSVVHDARVEKVATTLAVYADEALARRRLRETTRELYAKLLRVSIEPTFGNLVLAEISPAQVSRWYSSMASTPTQQANAYGLLKSILKDAVEDELIDRNPCKVRAGSTKTRAKEPEALTAAELRIYLAAAPAKYRPALLLAGWCALRSGEVRGLRRRDLDLDAGVVRVEQQAVKVGAGYVLTRPKTAAGVRTVAIPSALLPGLREWLDASLAPDDLLFTSEAGGPMSASTLRDAHVKGRDAVGKPGLTVHALRHTGLTLAAQAGATVAELMARAGHATPSMAMHYQHAAQERDRDIADRLGA